MCDARECVPELNAVAFQESYERVLVSGAGAGKTSRAASSGSNGSDARGIGKGIFDSPLGHSGRHARPRLITGR